jgi:hypothetical protein
MVKMWLSETQKVGVAVSGFGLLFLVGGVVMFFDTGLLVIGNLMFLVGLVLVIGVQKTKAFFFQRRDKWRGSLCFFAGCALILARYAKLGMLLEAIGFVSLFGDFLPFLVGFARRLPVLGPVLNAPYVCLLVDKLFGANVQQLPR